MTVSPPLHMALSWAVKPQTTPESAAARGTFSPRSPKGRRGLLMRGVVALGLGALLLGAAASPARAEDPALGEIESAQEAMRQQLEEAARLDREARALREADEQARRAAVEAERAESERRAQETERQKTTRIQGEIADQQRVQSEMLRRARRNENAASRQDLGAHDDMEADASSALLESRVAPRAPEERRLPDAIFEESKVTLPARTWGNPKKLALLHLALDADGDGKPEIVRYVDPATRLRVRQEEDRNYDGLMDAWMDYREGEIDSRVLDTNYDGQPDVWERYRAGVMTAREVDRDEEGVKDGFYRFEGDSLVEERHDGNNDGKIDLVITYERRRRLRAEEDHDRDGRTDSWTSYGIVDGAELVTRIERDKQGRGFADTFEIFEVRSGKSILSRREEDVNGDGQVDVISIYQNGRLQRREISDPDIVPLL